MTPLSLDLTAHTNDEPVRHCRRGLFGRFGRSKRGVAALEFALIAPFLITLFLGGFELSRYISSIRQLTYLANSIAEMLAQNTSGTITDDDFHFAYDSAMVVYPPALSASFAQGTYWWMNMHITMSSVAFTPTVPGCTSGCTYLANAAWSSGAYQRACVLPLLPAADSAPPTPATLPTDIYGPGSLIVVDVVYTYVPTVATQIFGPMTIRRSAYIQPRYVPIVKYAGGNTGTKCPGY